MQLRLLHPTVFKPSVTVESFESYGKVRLWSLNGFIKCEIQQHKDLLHSIRG